MPDDKLPDMVPVTSSNVHSVGRNDTHLFVRFKSRDGTPGSLYRYPGAHHLHDDFVSAQSPGRYFQDKVKFFYQGERIG